MIGGLQRWLALSGPDRRLFLVLLFALPITNISLVLAGYVRTRRWIETMSRHANPRIATETDLAAAERVAELAGIAGRRGVITSTCLRQSLVVHAILRKRGLKPELKLGVRKRDGAVDAHAWVEVGSQALNSNALGADGFRSLQRPAEPNSSQRA